MIPGKDLETPERGLELEKREEGEERPARRRELAEVRALREETGRLRAELARRDARLEAAKRVKPKGSELHCGLCFSRGRDAAVRELEGGGGGGS